MRAPSRLPLAALILCLVSAADGWAFCPCYTLSSAQNSGNCGVEASAGTNPTTAQWKAIFSQVARGPAEWGTLGPAVGDLGQGCGKPEAPHPVPARFPCELLEAIAMQESSWQQFCVPTGPSDQVGGSSRTIISFDCGYGVAQVTSGMHRNETPAFDRARVAREAGYNAAVGAQILASKWKVTECVGDNQPSVIEHWYSAVWAYNGLAYINNPINPRYDATRGVYDPALGGAAPYQEKVFGWIEHPPSPGHWTPTAVAYPALADVGGASSPRTLPDPRCASPTQCSPSRPTHRSRCSDAGGVDAGPPAPDAGPGQDAGPEEVPDAGGQQETDGGARFDAGAPRAGSPRGRPLAEPGFEPVEVVGGCGCASADLGASGMAWLGFWALLRRRRR